MKTDLKTHLEDLVKKYETKEFIVNDPIQFPHRFKDKKDIPLYPDSSKGGSSCFGNFSAVSANLKHQRC